LISLMRCKDSTIFGKNKLMIPSEFVDLEGGVNQRFRAACKEWEIHDRYRNPGPI